MILPTTLATLVIQFCGIKSQIDLFEDPAKYTCSDFMINCSVGLGGTITADQIETCKQAIKETPYEELKQGNVRFNKKPRRAATSSLPR